MHILYTQRPTIAHGTTTNKVKRCRLTTIAVGRKQRHTMIKAIVWKSIIEYLLKLKN